MVLLGACTTTTITPEFIQPAQENIDAVVVTDITTDNELWQVYLPHVRHGLVTNLQESGAFEKVIVGSSEPAPPSAITITGKLTDIDKGSTAARWIIGFGAGRAKARGAFEIKDLSGLVLVKFESWKAYSGGAGLGGANFLDMDDLAQQLGQETAGSIIRWTRGEPLEPPAKKAE
jgi:hypothetical protein